MNTQSAVFSQPHNDPAKPVSDHIGELRRSLVLVAACLVLVSVLAFMFFEPILKLFQEPLNQTLYFTTPAGGLTFTVKLCLTIAAVVSIPVFLNRIFSFVKPAVNPKLHRTFAWYTVLSAFLAVLGVVFAYYLSLPAALGFLTSIHVGNIKPLITADSYYSFLTTYLIGYALLFQTPVIIMFIDKVRPRGPKDFMRYQRHVIAVAFVVAALLTPTPDPFNQLMMAVPIIVLYQIGILAVWRAHRKRKKALARAAAEITKQEPIIQLADTKGIVPVPTVPIVTAIPASPKQPHLVRDITPIARSNRY